MNTHTIPALYAAADIRTIQEYAGAHIRAMIVATELAMVPAAAIRAELAAAGYKLLEIEAATAILETYDGLRFVELDGVDTYVGRCGW